MLQEPVDEVVRLAVDGAGVARLDVQQVFVRVGVVGDTARDRITAVEQQDAQRLPVLANQLRPR